MLRILSILFILIIIPANVMAANINAKGAETLKESFQNLLDYYKASNEILGDIEIIYDGKINVKQEAEYYTITLPNISFKNPKTEDKTQNYTLNIGIITINATPDNKSGYWKTILNLPNNLTLSNDIAEEDVVFSFKDQKTIALFNENLGYFTKLNMNLSNITIRDNKENLAVNIGKFQIYSKLEENDSGKFSGLGYFTINNLTLSDKKSDETINLGEFKLDFNMSELKLPTLTEYQDKITKHKETFASLSNLNENSNADNIDGSNVIDMILDLYSFEMKGGDFQYSIKDLDISEYSTNDEKGIENFKIGSAFIGLSFDGLNADKGTISMKTGYTDIEMLPPPPEYSNFFPKNMNFSIKAENIPYTNVSKLAINSAKSVAKAPEMMSMAGMGILMRLPAILSQADAKIIFENNGIKNDIYDININGEIATDLAAMMSFSANFLAIFKGLDDILAITKKSIEDKESPYITEITDLSKTLEKLKEIGKSQTESDGTTSYSFDIKSTPEGKLMINDIDTSTITYD